MSKPILLTEDTERHSSTAGSTFDKSNDPTFNG